MVGARDPFEVLKEEEKKRKKVGALDVSLSNYVTVSKSPITSLTLMFNSVIAP